VSTEQFVDYAREDFYRWLNSQGKDARVYPDRDVRLAELAYREATRVQFKRAFEMGKCLAHPDLHVIAGALQAQPVTLSSESSANQACPGCGFLGANVEPVDHTEVCSKCRHSDSHDQDLCDSCPFPECLHSFKVCPLATNVHFVAVEDTNHASVPEST
jgi:hypothetical protein